MSKETSNDATIPMTPEQKFFFDLRGWILLPSILSDSEIEEMKAEVYAGARQSYQGALQSLLDHPAIVGVLNEILSEDPFVRDDCYGFRCEGSFTTVRPPGWSISERGDNGLPTRRTPPAASKCNAVSGGWWKDLRGIDARRLGT